MNSQALKQQIYIIAQETYSGRFHGGFGHYIYMLEISRFIIQDEISF